MDFIWETKAYLMWFQVTYIPGYILRDPVAAVLPMLTFATCS